MKRTGIGDGDGVAENYSIDPGDGRGDGECRDVHHQWKLRRFTSLPRDYQPAAVRATFSVYPSKTPIMGAGWDA